MIPGCFSINRLIPSAFFDFKAEMAILNEHKPYNLFELILSLLKQFDPN